MDLLDYRRALGAFTTGVTVVTAFDDNASPWGVTANSFTSVSLQPPIISVCIAKAGRTYATFAKADKFAVNILSAEQQPLAQLFAGKSENRFEQTNWQANTDGAPLLPGASAQLDCLVHARFEAGDHEILLGKVERYHHAPSVSPLAYCRGKFFAVSYQELSHV